MSASLARRDDGGVELHDWPAWAVRVLEEMALLAGPEIPDPRAQRRIFQRPVAPGTAEPAPGRTEHIADEWERNVHPELFALFASAQKVVLKDLGDAERDADGSVRRLLIPRENLAAWISALNMARQHLAAAHDVDAAAMRTPFDELDETRRPAVVRIDMLGELQAHLIASAEPVDETSGAGDAGSAKRARKPAKKPARKPPAKRATGRAPKPSRDAGAEKPPRKSAKPPSKGRRAPRRDDGGPR